MFLEPNQRNRCKGSQPRLTCILRKLVWWESHLGVLPHRGPQDVPIHHSFPQFSAVECSSSTHTSRTSQGPFQQNNTTPSSAPAPAGSGATPSPPPGFAHPGARSSYSLPSRHPCLCPRQSHSSTRVRPRSNLGLCGPAWALPLPLPSLPKGQEGQDGARGVSRVNRLGAAGVWSSRDGTHRNVHSQ